MGRKKDVEESWKMKEKLQGKEENKKTWEKKEKIGREMKGKT